MDGKETKTKEMKMMLRQARCERSAGSSDTFLTIYIRAQAVRSKGPQHGDRAAVKEAHGPRNKCRLVNVSPRGRTGSAQHVCIRTAQIRLETLPLLPHAAGARKAEWAESVPAKDDKERK